MFFLTMQRGHARTALAVGVFVVTIMLSLYGSSDGAGEEAPTVPAATIRAPGPTAADTVTIRTDSIHQLLLHIIATDNAPAVAAPTGGGR